MNLPHLLKQRLKANWGDKATALACYAEVRYYDPLSCWECFLLALEPTDEDTMYCIIKGDNVEVCEYSLKKLYSLFNAEGVSPRYDVYFRRQRADVLLRKLEGRR